MVTKVYAKIVNDIVVEYPADHRQGTEGLTEVELFDKPAYNPFVHLVETIEKLEGKWCHYWKEIPKTRQEYVDEHYLKLLEPFSTAPRYSKEYLSEELIQRLINNLIRLGTWELDRFAQSRGYDNLLSLVSYRGDQYEIFRQEAERGFHLRSVYWSNFHKLLYELESGGELPRTMKDIMDLFPELSWE